MRLVCLGFCSVIGLVGSSALFAACGPTSSTCEERGTCGAGGASSGGAGGTAGTSGSGGADGGAGTGGTSGTGGTAGTGGNGGSDASTCDPSKTPGTEACLVADKYAVFVDGTVATTGDGSQASPFKSIGEAISAAGGKLVLVCDATYDEQVKVTAGVRMYGGFKCTDWTYEGGQRAVVAPVQRATRSRSTASPTPSSSRTWSSTRRTVPPRATAASRRSCTARRMSRCIATSSWPARASMARRAC